MSDINYASLPEHLRSGMQRYIERGVKPGSFLTALLCNDLMGAARRADDVSRARFFDICRFLDNEAPPDCFGSPDRISVWSAAGGLNGKSA